MKVLHVIGSLAPRYGGPSTVVMDLCQELAKRGHEVEIFTTDIDGSSRMPVPLDEPTQQGGIAVTYHAGTYPRRYGTSVGLARTLARRVRQFDVVHIHSLYRFHTLVGGALCGSFGVPYILRPHGVLDPYHRAVRRRSKAVYDALWEHRNMRRAAALHLTSSLERQMADQVLAGLRSFVVPNGVDISRFESASDSCFAAHYPDLADSRLVTFLGRLTPKKGADVLLEAFPRIANAIPDSRLVIAGPDEAGIEAQLRRRVDMLGLGSRVSLLGMLTGELKVGLLQRSTVFVLPSFDENFGVAVVEAMAAGTPVVVTKGVGIHEEIEAAEAGLVVPRSADAVAIATIQLLANPTRAESLARNAQNLARGRFSLQKVAAEVEEMYREILTSETWRRAE